MTSNSFAHLHVHTEHSPLDGLAKLKDLFRFVADAGMRTCAVTDHGTLSGLWAAQEAADKAGVTLMPGCEFYLAYGSRFDPGSEDVIADDGDDSDDATGGRVKTRRYQHLTVLAITPDGWRSLVRLKNESERTKVTVAGKKYPLIDLDLLEANRDGIVVLTGCLGGPVLGPLSRGDEATARANIEQLRSAVGGENLYLEIMSHGIPAEDAVLPRMAELADDLQLTLVATNDSHYLHDSDAGAHDAWLALRTKKQITETARYRFSGSGYHVKTEAEMRAVRPEPWWQNAVTAAGAVADRCARRVLPKPEPMLPSFPTPPGFASNREYLIHQISDGARARWGNPLPPAVQDRLNTEFSVIMNPSPEKPELSFDSYMLMVAEMVQWEQQQGGLVGGGRGSAAGSAIAYSLGITALDPLQEGLLFERFLEPGRADWPDIDTDFQKRRRDEVLDHLEEFWGADRVVQIGAFAQSKSKRALRDAARVLGVSHVGDVLAKAVPIVDGGKPMSLEDITDDTNPATGEFRRMLTRHGDDAEHVVALARSFEDTTAGLGNHACGVLVADRNLFDLIPLRRHNTTGRWITEWDSRNIEQLGGVKLDVLALRNLDIVADAIDMIAEQTGERIEFTAIPDGDRVEDPHVQSAWRLLQDGRTAGIFQMESSQMAQLARDVKPTAKDDLSAVIALYRPGPLSAGMDRMYAARKNGAEQIDYSWLTTDPMEIAWIDSVLGETHGLIVYQEQMMRLAGIVAGFDASERSKLRKAVGKKLKDVMADVGAMLIARADQEYRDAAGNVISPVFRVETVERLYDAIKGAAEYSFNKSHSAAYALLGWQTAYLKANWPAAYGAAILASTTAKDKRIEALHALAADGIEVLPPDVNRSAVTTRPESARSVRLGLAEVSGTGEQVAERIVATREASGPFTSLHDFMFRVRKADDSAELGASAADLLALIEAGAFDELGPRMGLSIIARTARTADLPVPEIEWGVIERTSRQRQRLLTVVGENPLERFQNELRAWNVPGPVGPSGEVLYAPGTPVGRLPDTDGASVTTIGILSAFSTRTYRGGTMANLTIEGTNAQIRGVIWDEALRRAQDTDVIPAVGQLIGATGRIQVRELETENEDGEEVTVQLREITVTTLYPVPVHDPVVGGFDDDVDVPDLIVPGVMPAGEPRASTIPTAPASAPTGDDHQDSGPDDAKDPNVAAEPVTREETPSPDPGDFAELFGATPSGTPSPGPASAAAAGAERVCAEEAAPVSDPQLDEILWDVEPLAPAESNPADASALATPGLDVPHNPDAAVPTIAIVGGWPVGADEVTATLADMVVALLSGGSVPGVHLQRFGGAPSALMAADGRLLAHVVETL